MRSKFDWETEEGSNWERATRDADTRRKIPPRILLGLVLILTLGGAGFIVLRQVDQRVEDVAVDIETEVLASHDLVRYAAEQKDAEVLAGFLSGRDPNWSGTQESLTRKGVLFGRAGLGLTLRPAGGPGARRGPENLAVTNVTLSPDLTEAEVSIEQAFATEIGHGLTQTVRLQQTTVYRRGPGRWLLSPRVDSAAYWGETLTWDGRLLVVTFPERDETIGRRLAAGIEAKLVELCDMPDLICPAGWRLNLSLDSNPEALTGLADPHERYRSRLDITLPAPSLVGLPVDELSYQALFRGYAAFLVSIAFVNLVEYQCCVHFPIVQVVVDKVLNTLGLQPWPLDRERDASLLLGASSPATDVVALGWAGTDTLPDAEMALIYEMADFLLGRGTTLTPAAMARELVGASSFSEWLVRVDGQLP